MKRLLKENPNAAEYSQYIHIHVGNVLRSWNEILKPAIEENMEDLGIDENDIKKIGDNIRTHDSSKWESEEWFAYLNHWYPTPEYPDNKEEYDYAWLHHQHSNGHHWQHWILVRDEGNIYPLDMPLEEICSMICDWHSFSISQDENTAYDWYHKNGSKMILSNNTRDIVEILIEYMKEPLEADYDVQ